MISEPLRIDFTSYYLLYPLKGLGGVVKTMYFSETMLSPGSATKRFMIVGPYNRK
jgi:hypothetical protein